MNAPAATWSSDVAGRPPGRPESTRFAWLDRVRGLASVYVVLHHAMLNVAHHGAVHGAMAQVLWLLLGQGHYAVDVFIVLSGYCLMLPLARAAQFGKVRSFLIRRTLRIAGPYYAAMAVSLLLIALWIGTPTPTHWSAALPVTGWGVVAHGLMIHQWWAKTAAQINHVFWSVGVEYQIYFAFPLFFWCGTRYGFRRATAAAVAIGYAGWFASRRVGWPNPSPWGASIYYLGLFCLGALAAKEVWERRLRATTPGWFERAVPWFIAAGIAVAWAMPILDRVDLQKRSLPVGVTAALYLYRRGLRDHAGREARPSTRTQVVTGWLGKIAFSLYLIHAPILELVWRYVLAPLHIATWTAQVGIMIALGGAASLGAAAVFYRFVEAPCHAASRRFARAKPVVT